jgi:hypothetical protein
VIFVSDSRVVLACCALFAHVALAVAAQSVCVVALFARVVLVVVLFMRGIIVCRQAARASFTCCSRMSLPRCSICKFTSCAVARALLASCRAARAIRMCRCCCSHAVRARYRVRHSSRESLFARFNKIVPHRLNSTNH